MQTISNSPVLDTYIADLRLHDIMNLSHIRPVLCAFHKGELLTGPERRQQYLFFVVSGKVQVYGVDAGGRKIPVNIVGKGALIGDVEFCRSGRSALISEAVTDLKCVGISVSRYRKTLEEDVRFLHFLLKSISDKVYLTETLDGPVVSVEEKLIHYLSEECEDGVLSGVEHGALRLRCSRRQLQRVLSSLCEEGRIVKAGKGKYRLTDDVNIHMRKGT